MQVNCTGIKQTALKSCNPVHTSDMFIASTGEKEKMFESDWNESETILHQRRASLSPSSESCSG